ncbi:hypothetical protein HDU84_003525 [Entophlyctis sp. JEL0112]|nr:hypothetical protein HDU84_003525 [Entophlyctis sp. JEL0112]
METGQSERLKSGYTKQTEHAEPTVQSAVAAAEDRSDIDTIVSNKAIDWSIIDPDNRRSYHNLESSIYVLPEEEREQKRLMLQVSIRSNKLNNQGYFLNRILGMAFGSYVLAPLRHPNKSRTILDVGCANGEWLESVFFSGNISSHFHGVDITLNPSNLGTVCGAKIVFGDVTDRLPYPDNMFDYVHQRALVLAIPKQKWPHVLNELIRVTKPGGWIELVESSGKIGNATGASKAFADRAEAALKARGADIDLVANLPEYVNACANLTNTDKRAVEIPLGWGGEIGELYAEDCRSAMVHAGDFLQRAFGMESDEYAKLVEGAAADWPKSKAHSQWIAVWGQVVK